MYNRREVLKHFALLGAASALPVHALSADGVALPKSTDDGLFAVNHDTKISRKTYPPRTIIIPDVGEFKVLKGDFHMHTLFSDGRVMPKERVDEAVDNGLDVIAITDHIEVRPNIGNKTLQLAKNNDDHNAAYKLAKPDADKNNLILVRATEVTKQTMPPGHFNALFIEDANAIAAVVDDWQKMLAVATEQGGFVQWNHPGWVAPGKGGLDNGQPMQFFDEIEKVRARGHLHGVEVFNGTSFYPIALDWCNERNLAPMAVTDIHQSDWNTYGHQNPLRPMTLILAKDRSLESVREAFFARRTIGWAANMIFGCQPWVEKLFRASVEIKKTGDALTLQNRSSIPCLIEANGKSTELAAMEVLTIGSPQKLSVSNWFVGMNKPLEVTI